MAGHADGAFNQWARPRPAVGIPADTRPLRRFVGCRLAEWRCGQNASAVPRVVCRAAAVDESRPVGGDTVPSEVHSAEGNCCQLYEAVT